MNHIINRAFTDIILSREIDNSRLAGNVFSANSFSKFGGYFGVGSSLRKAIFVHRIANVIALSTDKHVNGTYAGGSIATMAELQPIRNRTNLRHIGETVCHNFCRLFIHIKASITFPVKSALPQPARQNSRIIGNGDFVPKAGLYLIECASRLWHVEGPHSLDRNEWPVALIRRGPFAFYDNAEVL